MTWEFEAVAGPHGFTEGPVWDPETEVVFFTDIPTSRVLRYDPASGECTEWATETNRGNGWRSDLVGKSTAVR
jgi:gluconolactonase